MIDDLVSQIETRFSELEQQLSDPDVIGDRDAFRAASKAYSELEPAAKLAQEYRRGEDGLEGGGGLLGEGGEEPALRGPLRASRRRRGPARGGGPRGGGGARPEPGEKTE